MITAQEVIDEDRYQLYGYGPAPKYKDRDTVLLLKAIVYGCYMDGAFVHHHDPDMKSIFHYLEKKGVLEREYEDRDWSYKVTAEWRPYVWFY